MASSGRFRYKPASAGWEVVPKGSYVLRLTGIEDGPTFSNRTTGAPETPARFKLVVDRGPSKGMALDTLVNLDAKGPKANATKWAEALTGREVDEGEELDFEEFVDTLVWAQVDVKQDSKGADRNFVDIVLSLAAIEMQSSGVGTAAPRAPAPPPRTGLPLAPGLEAQPPARRVSQEPDRTLELPDEAWDQMDPGEHPGEPEGDDEPEAAPVAPTGPLATAKQLETIARMARAAGTTVDTEGLTRAQASEILTELIGAMGQLRAS